MSCQRILVVEDETIVAMDIRHRLEKMGYEILDVVAMGEEAIEKAGTYRPDVVLMDIMLEGEMDGVEAAGLISEELSIPVVYLTAYADDDTLTRVKQTQPFGYVIKPFEDREIRTAIEMACYMHRVEQERSENQRWLQTTLNSIGEGVVATDHLGRINYMNELAGSIFNCTLQDIRNKPLAEVLRLTDAVGQSVDLVETILSQGQSLRSDSLVLSAEGGEIPVALFGTEVQGRNGSSQGVVVSFRNITGRMENVRQLRQSVNQLRQTVEATVQALVVTSEKRDPYTAGHQQRVARLAVAIAIKMGFDEGRIDAIRVTGLLHDLGKIYIPAEILSKPARLTDMEMGLMRTHSEAGYDILSTVPFPWNIAEFVLQHHERLDGTGYPRGLKGDDILPEARIISVADVVEAMSSHRPYRPALGFDRALTEIRQGRGVRYDVDAVDACLALFEQGFSFE